MDSGEQRKPALLLLNAPVLIRRGVDPASTFLSLHRHPWLAEPIAFLSRPMFCIGVLGNRDSGIIDTLVYLLSLGYRVFFFSFSTKWCSIWEVDVTKLLKWDKISDFSYWKIVSGGIFLMEMIIIYKYT